MALLSRREWKLRSADRAAEAERVKALARAEFGLSPEDGVTASEIACADPGCPDVETVFLIMRAGQPTRAVKVSKKMADVGRDDLAAALAAPPEP